MEIEYTISANNIEAITEELKKKVKAALEAVGLEAQGDVSLLAPADTGRLRGSITYATVDKRSEVRPPTNPSAPANPKDAVQGTPDDNSVLVGTNVEYAAYVEYGTSKMDARPYLSKGISNNIDKYGKIMEKMLKE